jgi:hypothetical protein
MNSLSDEFLIFFKKFMIDPNRTRGVVLLKIPTILFTFLFCTMGVASEEQTNSHWLSSYQLTSIQVELLLRWESEKKFDHSKLVSFAETFQRHNLKTNPFVPEHTLAELEEVAAWAEGAAFSIFAFYAGYDFDNDAYNAACPNKVLFHFGYSTGKEYLQIDVLARYMSRFDGLQISFSHAPETFPQKFLELAQARGFDVYLSPLNR